MGTGHITVLQCVESAAGYHYVLQCEGTLLCFQEEVELSTGLSWDRKCMS
jgi:hypothetical protein